MVNVAHDFESLKENTTKANIGAYKNKNTKNKYILENTFFILKIVTHRLLCQTRLQT